MTDPVFSVSDAVAVLNQTLDYAYPNITIIGEISGFTVSKGKWLYFDIKDDQSKMKCFGTVFQLKMPIEDGMKVQLVAHPKLHNQFGFSLTVASLRPVGEGSIKKAATLLQAKLEAEGLFAVERKRSIPRFVHRIGLVASNESAAYADFVKILNQRWQGVEVVVFNTHVQGESAVDMLVDALAKANQYSDTLDAIVMIRGGGSADDLSAFSSEPVVRAVASSRIPVCAAIGHEVDVSLSELAADLHASTPSNAAELLFPDKQDMKLHIASQKKYLLESAKNFIQNEQNTLHDAREMIADRLLRVIDRKQETMQQYRQLLDSLHPKNTLKRGYALVQVNGKLLSDVSKIKPGQSIELTVASGTINATVNSVKKESS